MIRDAAVVFADGEAEAGQRLHFEARQSEEVDKHEDAAAHLVHVVDAVLVEPKLVQTGRRLVQHRLAHHLRHFVVAATANVTVPKCHSSLPAMSPYSTED